MSKITLRTPCYVKPLAWEALTFEFDPGRPTTWPNAIRRPEWRSQTPFLGQLYIQKHKESYYLMMPIADQIPYDTLEEAKKAAEEWYLERVGLALEPCITADNI